MDLDELDEALDPPTLEVFDTEAEAKGFAYGLTWGDDPDFEVLAVEQNASRWAVEFRRVDD